VKLLLSHKIFSVIVSFLVLLSTFSFTIEKHYCGERLVDVSLFSEAKGCGMEMPDEAKEKKSCCKDVVDVIEGQDELSKVVFEDLELSTQLFISSYIYTYTSLFESLPKKINPHRDYLPPNIVYDIQLLDAVFLI